MTACPCGSQESLDECCGLYLTLRHYPKTPEQLMRSRYTAFATNNMDYIVATMKPPALERFLADPRSSTVSWFKLEVLRAYSKKSIGFVEFRAHFYEQQKAQVMQELSEFHLIDGRWYYVDGQFPPLANPI